MNNTDDRESKNVEDLLRAIPLAGPSSRLDRRIEQIGQPWWGRLAGPAYGFAAGVLVTVGVMLAIPASTSPSTPSQASVASSPIEPPPEPAKTAIQVRAEPHTVVEQFQGDVDGVPIMLERTSQQVVLRPVDASPHGNWTTLVLPQSVSIRQVRHY